MFLCEAHVVNRQGWSSFPGGGEVNSLTGKKLKNAKVNEAQNITVSRSSESAGFNKSQNWLRMEMVIGSRFWRFISDVRFKPLSMR